MLNRFRLLICILFFWSNSYAEQNMPTLAQHPLWDTKTMITVGELLSELRNNNPSNIQNAKIYIIGVLDASEGRSWCGYDGVLPHDMTSYVYGELLRVERSKRNDRAAYFIVDHLAKSLPCKKGKR